MYYYRKKGFTVVELMLVLVIIGIMSAIAIPSYIKRIHSQRIKVGANQLLTHLFQTRERATKRHEFYRVNLSKFKNAYLIEKCGSLSSNDSDWEAVPLLGQDSAEPLIAAGDTTGVDLSKVVFLPKDVRIDPSSTPLIIYEPKGYLHPTCIPAKITLTTIAQPNRKIFISVSIAGFAKITGEER